MAWIRMIALDDAEGRLQRLYQHLLNEDGDIDHIIKVHSLNPASMDAHLKLYRTVMTGSEGLSKARREMIAVTVSVANHCHY